MRHFAFLTMFAGWIALASVLLAGVGRPIELTPQNMVEQGFDIECRFRDQTIKEGNNPTRPTGVVLIQVLFDAEKGSRIKEFDSAALIIKQGEQTLWIPVQWTAGQKPGFIQFALPEAMISESTLLLQKSTEANPSSYSIVLKHFRK